MNVISNSERDLNYWLIPSIYYYLIYSLKKNNGHRSIERRSRSGGEASQAEETGSITQLLLHGRQVPPVHDHQHHFLSCSVCRPVPGMQLRALQTHWWKVQAQLGNCLEKKGRLIASEGEISSQRVTEGFWREGRQCLRLKGGCSSLTAHPPFSFNLILFKYTRRSLLRSSIS